GFADLFGKAVDFIKSRV
uniref:Signiferin-4.3 n=2 Tax=Crinia signifera TaxID=326986 RepID=SIG43_CRISI|nr:RecName: Full=Signiferin-4.3 [Crinia signifera]